MEHLKQVPAPRVKRTRRHELMDILVIALCAVLGGANDWVEIVLVAKAKKQWFSTFLNLANGIPSHDTFGRVIRILDSQVREQGCVAWLQSIAGQVQGVMTIDGKSLCGSRDGKKSPLHIVSAWACQNSMLLGQVQTDKNPMKSTPYPSYSSCSASKAASSRSMPWGVKKLSPRQLSTVRLIRA